MEITWVWSTWASFSRNHQVNFIKNFDNNKMMESFKLWTKWSVNLNGISRVISLTIWITDNLVCYSDHGPHDGPLSYKTTFYHVNLVMICYSDPHCFEIFFKHVMLMKCIIFKIRRFTLIHQGVDITQFVIRISKNLKFHSFNAK